MFFPRDICNTLNKGVSGQINMPRALVSISRHGPPQLSNALSSSPLPRTLFLFLSPSISNILLPAPPAPCSPSQRQRTPPHRPPRTCWRPPICCDEARPLQASHHQRRCRPGTSASPSRTSSGRVSRSRRSLNHLLLQRSRSHLPRLTSRCLSTSPRPQTKHQRRTQTAPPEWFEDQTVNCGPPGSSAPGTQTVPAPGRE